MNSGGHPELAGADPGVGMLVVLPAGACPVHETARLAAWLARPADEPRERVEVLLKVFHGGAVGPAVVAEHLGTFRAQQEALLARYAEYAADLQEHMAEDPNHPYILLTLRCGEAISKALREWCDEALETLAGLPGGQPGTSEQGTGGRAGS